MNGWRVPLVGLMAIVALAAADCLAVRWLAVRGSRSILFLYGLLPSVNVLGIGLLIGLRGLVIRRRCPSFLVGFEVMGWIAAAAYAIVCLSPSALDIALGYLGIVLGPFDAVLNRMGFAYDDSSVLWRLLSDACSSAALSAPLLACAFAGGWFFHRFEIWLARGAWFVSAESQMSSA